jgi:hypothetical protein
MRRRRSWLGQISLALVVSAAGCGAKDRKAVVTPMDAQVAALAPDSRPLDPDVEAEIAAGRKVVRVFRCLDRDMRARAQTPEFAAYRRNIFTELFVFDAVFAPGKLEVSEGELCAAAGEQYRRLFRATVAKRPARPAAGAAVPEQAVDAEPGFIRAAGLPTALHMLEHAELTRAALREVAGGQARAMFEPVVAGALEADFQSWGDVQLHAVTDEHAPSERQAAIASSQDIFAARLSDSLAAAVRHARNGYFANAALKLGTACHSVQDLALHRGASRRQLAGLRFHTGKDPSGFPVTTHGEAMRLTGEILRLARAAIGPAQWKAFVSWTPPLGFDAAHAWKVLGTTTGRHTNLVSLGLAPLTRYWASQLVYQRSPDAREELADGPAGLCRWNVAAILEHVRKTVPSGRVALHRASP